MLFSNNKLHSFKDVICYLSVLFNNYYLFIFNYIVYFIILVSSYLPACCCSGSFESAQIGLTISFCYRKRVLQSSEGSVKIFEAAVNFSTGA